MSENQTVLTETNFKRYNIYKHIILYLNDSGLNRIIYNIKFISKFSNRNHMWYN